MHHVRGTFVGHRTSDFGLQFITNNVVGPELSGFAKVLFGRIELDLAYLSSEISESTAHELLSELEVSLRKLAA
jgi:hypothetical protein